MAIWQCEVRLVPKAYIGKDTKQIDLDEYNEAKAWQDFKNIPNLISSITFLPKAESWAADILMWGEDNGDRLEVIMKGAKTIEGIEVRIDMGAANELFLKKLCIFAKKWKCVFVTGDGEVIKPYPWWLEHLIYRRQYARNVGDPDGWLRMLGWRKQFKNHPSQTAEQKQF